MTRCLLMLGTIGWLLVVLSATPAAAGPSAAHDYALFSLLPLEQRRAVYPTLDAETKSQLWREQIDMFLSTHPRLSSRAWLELHQAQETLTPDLFADLRWPQSPEHQRAERIVRDLESRIREELSVADRAALFGRIGPGGTPALRSAEGCVFLWAMPCAE